MKKILGLIIILNSINCYSQINKPITKGNFELGGNIGMGFNKSTITYKSYNLNTGDYYSESFEQKIFSVNANPSVGYFIVDGLVLGISPSFSYSNSRYSDNTANYYGIGIGPYIKYYFKNCLFMELETWYTYSINNNFNNKYTNNSFTISPRIGYAIFINSNVSIEPSLAYRYNKNIDKSDDAINDSDIQNHSISFSIGFNIFL